MDDFDRVLYEYVAIVITPSLESPLTVLATVVLIVALAMAVAILVAGMHVVGVTTAAPVARRVSVRRAPAIKSRPTRSPVRARAPSGMTVFSRA